MRPELVGTVYETELVGNMTMICTNTINTSFDMY